MKDLLESRKEIDEIDDSIISLKKEWKFAKM